MKIKTTKLLLSLTAFILLAACNTPLQKEKAESPAVSVASSAPTTERYAMITGLEADKVAYYKELHAAVWPGVLKKITECNIRNYSIYLKEIDGKPYLFSYFEYAGTDFASDMRKMAADTTTQRWWKETSPTQRPLPDAAAKGETWSSMQQVFHCD